MLTLAIGIGANTAIFSVISGVLLKPLPYPRSDELVILDHAAPGLDIDRAGAAPFLYYTYREDGRVFQDVGCGTPGTVSVTGIAKPEEVRTLFDDRRAPADPRGAAAARARFTRADDSRGRRDRDPDGRLLAAEVRRRPVGDRPHDHAGRPPARDHRRPA